MLLSRSISSSVDSAQASQPQTGKSSVCHRPKRICRPGKVENTTAMGAASVSMGLSLTDGRARTRTFSSSSSRPYPSVRSTSKSSASRSTMSSMVECRGRKRSTFVKRPYASSGGPPGPQPRLSDNFQITSLGIHSRSSSTTQHFRPFLAFQVHFSRAPAVLRLLCTAQVASVNKTCSRWPGWGTRFAARDSFLEAQRSCCGGLQL